MLGKGDYKYALPFYGERRSILIDLALHPEPEREKITIPIFERKRRHPFRLRPIPPVWLWQDSFVRQRRLFWGTPKGRDRCGHCECIRGQYRTQNMLRKTFARAEERYRSHFENAPGRDLPVNTGGKNHHGQSRHGQDIWIRFPGGNHERITDVARQLYVDPEDRTKIRQIIEEQGLRQELWNAALQEGWKQYLDFPITMRAIRDEKGQLLYYEGMDEDITNRKRAKSGWERLWERPLKRGILHGRTSNAESPTWPVLLHGDEPFNRSDRWNPHGCHHSWSRQDIRSGRDPQQADKIKQHWNSVSFKTHAQSGYDILKDIDFPWPIARMVLEHHERMDGSGYPNGLIAEETLLSHGSWPWLM